MKWIKFIVPLTNGDEKSITYGKHHCSTAFTLRGIVLIAILGSFNAAAQNSSAFYNDFIAPSHMDLSLRNQWKYLKENAAQPKAVHNAWGQGTTLNFKSGYLWDAIGFDAGYSKVFKLAASDYFSTRALLYNDGQGMDKNNAKGFDRFGQRYIKVKFGEKSLGMEAKGGWQEMKNFGVLTTSSRLAKNSYLGYSGSFVFDDVVLQLGRVTQAINRDSPEKTHFQTADKKNIASIFTGGLGWKNDKVSFSYGYGEAKNYQRRHVTEVAWYPVPQWTFASQIYGSQALDKYERMPTSKKDFDNQAWHYVGETQWKNADWLFRLAAGYTHARKEGGVGTYNRHIAKNTRGRFNALTSAGTDYMRHGEAALVLYSHYQVTRNFTSGMQWNYGQFKYKDNLVRSGEATLINIWAPDSALLKDLSVFFNLGYGWSYKNVHATPTLTNAGKYMRSPSLSSEIIIDYKFSLF
ncbi:OprD family outer membrane porin [Cedecea colo]|uniref:Outer membrane porin, OprD family n=1 Tax=Cedecea colo TaxID=2552946 RepID=A0ABX0VPV7_9ENTR|nr:OprD family outer membrane porin [Cedecea colo]NIY48818.1 outer membrane porin, OprD family [Cedecea colo]